MKIGYVLCADIMGFSKLVDHLDGLSLENKINDWINLVMKASADCNLSKVRLWSDTVYVAVDNDKSELKKLIEFSKNLLNEGINISLPIRGAISFGQYNWKSLIYGKAVLAAHRLEKIQKWIGIVLDPAIDIQKDEAFYLGLEQYFVPITNENSRFFYSVIWNIPFFYELSLKTSPTKHLTYDKYSLEKIRNTAIFGKYLREGK